MEKDIKQIPLIEGRYYYCETTTQGRNIFIANPIKEIPSYTMAYVIYGIDDKRLNFNMGVCQDEHITLIRPATRSERERLDSELNSAISGFARYNQMVIDQNKYNEDIIKLIWNGIWTIAFFVGSILILFDIKDWKDWIVFGMAILLTSIYWNKAEDVFK